MKSFHSKYYKLILEIFTVGIFTAYSCIIATRPSILPLTRLFHASSQPLPQTDPHSRTRGG